MRIYTRTGDKGQTSLIGGRVDKDDVRVEAYGTVDEVNSFIGLAITELAGDKFADVMADLEKIQHILFDCGGDLANVSKRREQKLTAESVTYLEERIDQLTAEAPKLERFVLPGGTKAAGLIHVARTITRRAERLIVKLMKNNPDVAPVTLQFLNRLSDYLFALARVINFRSNVQDVEYERSGIVFREKRKKEFNNDDR